MTLPHAKGGRRRLWSKDKRNKGGEGAGGDRTTTLTRSEDIPQALMGRARLQKVLKVRQRRTDL